MARYERIIDMEETFNGGYITEPNSGCWIWLRALNANGYGTLKRKLAHRFSWELHNGVIPEGKIIMHSCDVKSCVNPDHLSIGTKKENTQDMMRKGRHHRHGITHCIHGHEYTTANTYVDHRDNGRVCRKCRNKGQEFYRSKLNARV